MASNSTISMGFKIEDAGGMKQLTVDAEGLRKIMEATVTESAKLEKSFLAYSSLSTGINNLTNTITGLQSSLGALTGFYAAQIEAETKLAVNMRNTMGATEEEIQSIKDLCSAQQDLGVVGEEAQRAAVLCDAVGGIISSKTKSPPLKIAEAIKGCE